MTRSAGNFSLVRGFGIGLFVGGLMYAAVTYFVGRRAYQPGTHRIFLAGAALGPLLLLVASLVD